MPDASIPPINSELLVSPITSITPLERLARKLRAIPKDKCRPLNRDMVHAVTTVLAAEKRYQQLRPDMAALGKQLNLELIDDAADYARALVAVNATWVPRRPEVDALRKAHADGIALRVLMREAKQLVERRGVVGVQDLKLSSAVGHANVAMDLHVLVIYFERNAEALACKTVIDEEDLRNACQLAEQLMLTKAVSSATRKDKASTLLLRRQAFTAMVEAYSEVRRAVAFLRWHDGDAERFAPSLYAREKRRGRKATVREVT